MGRRIKTFQDGSFLEYDRGNFDRWCVSLTNANGFRTAPKDTDYLRQLKQFAGKYGTGKIYGDFVTIYNQTTKCIDSSVLSFITLLAADYEADELEIDKMFSTLYLEMIAEERKANTRLGKRIKRLGVHTLLIEGKSVEYAANFMKNMNWRQIDSLCKDRGF